MICLHVLDHFVRGVLDLGLGDDCLVWLEVGQIVLVFDQEQKQVVVVGSQYYSEGYEGNLNIYFEELLQHWTPLMDHDSHFRCFH